MPLVGLYRLKHLLFGALQEKLANPRFRSLWRLFSHDFGHQINDYSRGSSGHFGWGWLKVKDSTSDFL